MKNYELMVIISPKLTEEEANKLNESILNMVKQQGNGEIIKTDPWGLRKLAYPINKMQEAYYFVNYFSMEPNAVKPIKNQLNINEHVLRHMFIVRDK